MSGKASGIGDLIAVPQGGGAQQGLGEKFAPDLHTGTGNFSVPIALPPGRNGLQPQLSLGFSTGSGNGPFGLGWSLGVPGVSRLTSKGIPRYRDGAEADIFVLSGAEDLVEVARTQPTDTSAVTTYRPRTEGLFARIERHTGTSDHWEVRTKDGLISTYGTPGPMPGALADDQRAVVADPTNRHKVFAWRLTETRDPFGNRIVYEYERDNASGQGHNGEQIDLRTIRYVDLSGADQADFLVSVAFLYDTDPQGIPGLQPEFPRRPRPDAFSDYRAGFEIRTRRRCTGIVVRTHPSATETTLVRAYEFVYLDEQTTDPAALPPNGASLLSRINVIGYDDAGRPVRELPPLDFGYSRFTPEARRFFPLAGAALPMTSLANPDLELVDLFGHGLPDILELGSQPRYWRNLGDGRFDRPRGIPEVPAGVRLSDRGVQLIDANGDGRADLLVTSDALSGYYPLDFRAGFSKRSFQPYQQAPSFDLEDPEVRLVDLTGDGVTDVLRSGTSFECYFNDPTDGWLPRNTARVQRQQLAAFPNVDFAEPRVKFADLTGDGLQDIAVVYQGRVDYWPNLGYGRWAPRITTQIPGGLPFDFDPRRVLLADVDGDGLADLIYVSDREITLWINRTGNGWSAPRVIRGTPALTDQDTVRITDLLGTGVGGILWTRDADGSGRPSHFFLDLTGGTKPYLLERMDNNLGAVTEVAYASSTQFYLRDQARKNSAWGSTLPFPVQVVERVTVTDVFSGGTLTTEYRYHHGYWDGAEREFRGFGMVEQLDTEVFTAYAGRGLDAKPDLLRDLLAPESYAPPILTRTWFHQGPVIPDSGGQWRAMDYSGEYWQEDPNLLGAIPTALPELRSQRDAQRTLRGSILRSEVYALDGSPLQERPYTVTEHAYDLTEVDPPAPGSSRKPIYFPHGIAQRTTQWERGQDPQTQITYTSAFDDVGQPARQLAIACPRGWDGFADTPSAGYLATLSHTVYAKGDPAGPYLRDRVARTRDFELQSTGGLTVPQLLATTETSPGLRLIAESLNYYDGNKDPAAGYGAFTGLPFGQLGAFGALVRTEVLVMTQGDLNTAYGNAVPPYLSPGGSVQPSADYPAAFVAALPNRAGYLYQPASDHNTAGYFTIAASKRYDFHKPDGTGRGLLIAQRDPLGHESTIVAYDVFQLLPTRVRDPAGFETQARYNPRTLQPEQVTDPNGNVTRLAYSPTGLVTDTWALGKPNAPASDPANAGDRQAPGTHIEYHLRAFHDSRLADPANPQPVFARAIRRCFHDSDPDDTGETIEAREYSDGFGRLLQTRTQGEAVRFGDLHFGGRESLLPASQDQPSNAAVIGIENASTDAPNVIVSGDQRYDNKGQVIEKREPFFDAGWHYQPPTSAQRGRSVRMFYDPRGQVVRTLNPDGSEQRVIHGIPLNLADPPLSPLDTAKFTPTPWEAYTYDANDNAGRTHPGVKLHNGYPHHYNTPSSIAVDALGRTIRAVARHREAPPPDDPSALPPIEEHVTRSEYDIQGNLLRIRDALGRLAFEYVYDLAKHPLRTESIDAGRKLAVLDAAGNPIETRDAKGALALHGYDLLNRPTRLWARDAAGEPMTLREQLLYDRDPAAPDAAVGHNLLGKLWRHHDEAGVVTVAAYDFKGQVLGSSRQVLSDSFMLGNYNAHAEGTDWNLQVPRVDWANPPADLLDPTVYATQSAYDALGRIKWSEYPLCANGERYRLRPEYNRAGALERVDLAGPLAADGSGPVQPYVQRIAYNAKGQRTLIVYGNGLITRYAYDPDSFRLIRLRTDRLDPNLSGALSYQPQGLPLQDIAYGYDLAGNILSMLDRTPGCGVANNPEAIFNQGPLRDLLIKGDALLRCFEYDPLYRLVSATGREGKGIPSPRPWGDAAREGYNSGRHGTPDQDNAPNLTALYWEEYAYDAAGNMLTLRHSQCVQQAGAVGWNVSWSRRFGMGGRTPDQWLHESAGHLIGDWASPASNRLTHVQDRSSGVPTPPAVPQSHFYDANGNMVGEHTERHFEWDHADRMKVFRNQIDASAPTVYALYLYDAGGQRVKKLVVNGNSYRTTTYLGAAFEHHAEYDKLDGSGKVENCSLHVMDDKSRIAIKRLGPAFNSDGMAEHPAQYHLGDHLGSSGLVVSDVGEWINREEFFPYGETSFGSFGRKRYRFTGKERDEESGLNYHAARFYSPSIGRWITPDPVGPVSSVNLFRAVLNNPLVNIDPVGTVDGGVTLTPGDSGVLMHAADDGGAAPRPDAGTTEARRDGGMATAVDAGAVASPPDAGNHIASADGGITLEQLSAIFPSARRNDMADLARVLNSRGAEFGLNIRDPQAVAHFLAQVGTETNLRPQRENLTYSTASRLAVIWPTRFGLDAGVDAGAYVNNPSALGDFVYDRRMGNDAGQGYEYRGGGLIQTTGRDNYVALQRAITAGDLGDFDGGLDVVANPDDINRGDLPQLSALYYFRERVLRPNDGGLPDVRRVTRAVNGGEIGLPERQQTLNRALQVLRAPDGGP